MELVLIMSSVSVTINAMTHCLNKISIRNIYFHARNMTMASTGLILITYFPDNNEHIKPDKEHQYRFKHRMRPSWHFNDFRMV